MALTTVGKMARMAYISCAAVVAMAILPATEEEEQSSSGAPPSHIEELVLTDSDSSAARNAVLEAQIRAEAPLIYQLLPPYGLWLKRRDSFALQLQRVRRHGADDPLRYSWFHGPNSRYQMWCDETAKTDDSERDCAVTFTVTGSDGVRRTVGQITPLQTSRLAP